MTEVGLSPSSQAMLDMRGQVIEAWCQLARGTLCKAGELPAPILLNTLPIFYERLARLLTPEYYQASGVDVAVIAQEHGGASDRDARAKCRYPQAGRAHHRQCAPH